MVLLVELGQVTTRSSRWDKGAAFTLFNQAKSEGCVNRSVIEFTRLNYASAAAVYCTVSICFWYNGKKCKVQNERSTWIKAVERIAAVCIIATSPDVNPVFVNNCCMTVALKRNTLILRVFGFRDWHWYPPETYWNPKCWNSKTKVFFIKVTHIKIKKQSNFSTLYFDFMAECAERQLKTWEITVSNYFIFFLYVAEANSRCHLSYYLVFTLMSQPNLDSHSLAQPRPPKSLRPFPLWVYSPNMWTCQPVRIPRRDLGQEPVGPLY